MKQVPHPHNCPQCDCVWPCANPHCTDLECRWCEDNCHLCPTPPEWVRKLEAIQHSAHEVHIASQRLRQEGEAKIADMLDIDRNAILKRAAEIAKGENPK